MGNVQRFAKIYVANIWVANIRVATVRVADVLGWQMS